MEAGVMDLAQHLRQQARLHARATALVCADTRLTYAELFAQAQAVADALIAHGLRRNDVVAMDLERGAQAIVLLLAVLLAGAVSVPLDRSYPPARIAAMLEDAQPALLLAAADTLARLPCAATLQCLDPALLAVDGREHDAARSWPPMAERVYILFTSGSSGRPKGVAMRSEVLARLTAWQMAHPRLGTMARTLQFAPLSFDVAFQEILATLATAGTLVVATEAQRRDPYALLTLIEREGIERLYLPYVALQALAEGIAAGAAQPSTLRDVITAGEQLRVTPAIRAMFRALPDSVLHNHYGPTETHVVTAHELDGDAASWPELPPIGRPLPYVRVLRVDAALQPLDGPEEGELWLGGDCLAEGYVGRPELTRERFVEREGARWYRTGDRVRTDTAGDFHYLGRLDAQIKLHGYRIEPAEIETVLGRHPAVAEIAVVAAGEGAGRKLVAHVVLRDPQADDAAVTAALRAHAQAELAPYLVPQSFVIAPLLPLTASGKIDRRLLAQAPQAPLHWDEAAPLQQRLAGLWQQLLGLDVLDPQANVFDLGARSLTVVRALTQLRQRGFRTLTVAQIYQHPSVAGLAAALSAPADVPADDAAALQRGNRQRAALARFAPRQGGGL